MSFIIFTVAVAIVRNLYRAHVGKTNIKKSIKKRFRKVFGDDDSGAVDNSGLISYQGPEESKQPSDQKDPKGKVKDYYKKYSAAVMGKFGKGENDYENLDADNKEGDKD
jgi:hypothetical protein